MARRVILAAILMSVPLTGCLTPTKDYHGYIADEAAPGDITPGEDTRSTVLARLGSPSTKSVFDDNTWIYMSSTRERLAFMLPKTAVRTVTAIRFDDDDAVAEVGTYDVEDGESIRYASRETPTRGRELGFWEQIFGTVGTVALPRESDPNSPTGQRR